MQITDRIQCMEPLVKMHFWIVTIFPEVVSAYTQASILKRAQEKGLASIEVMNLRDFSTNKHHKVDDKAYGGGPGMVLSIEPLYGALEAIKRTIIDNQGKEALTKTVTVLTDAGGIAWNQSLTQQWLGIQIDAAAAEHSFSFSLKQEQDITSIKPLYTNVIIFAGRYQGVDERFKEFIDQQISVGPYVLTGGELPALIMVDSLVRLIPGVLGDTTSHLVETQFSEHDQSVSQKTYPVYTRPAVFSVTLPDGSRQDLTVPDYLKAGNHKEIRQHRGVKI